MPPAKAKPSEGGVDPVTFALAGVLGISAWCAYLVHRSAQAVIDAANDKETYVLFLTDEGAKSDNEFMADQLFRRLDARFYFLEFDSPRAGPIDALKYMPEDKTVALGLVTTKSPDLEQPEMLRARIQEASAFVSMDRLCLSPQCGFSGNVGNTVMTADQQFAKLRLLVETARSVWPDA